MANIFDTASYILERSGTMSTMKHRLTRRVGGEMKAPFLVSFENRNSVLITLT